MDVVAVPISLISFCCSASCRKKKPWALRMSASKMASAETYMASANCRTLSISFTASAARSQYWRQWLQGGTGGDEAGRDEARLSGGRSEIGRWLSCRANNLHKFVEDMMSAASGSASLFHQSHAYVGTRAHGSSSGNPLSRAATMLS